MAYRKTTRRKFHPTQVLPIWTTTETETVTLAFQTLLARLGITDIASYFRKLRNAVAVCVAVCACIGAATYGITGFILGSLAGLLAPAALLYLAVLLVGVAMYIAMFVAAWAAIWVIAKWFLSEFFRF